MVQPADHAEILRLLSKRNRDLGRQRARVVCRLHYLCAELVPGGIAKEMYVSDAEALLEKVAPETPVQQMRYDLVVELLDDVRRLDAQTRSRTGAYARPSGPRAPRSRRSMGWGRSTLRRSSAVQAISGASPTGMPMPHSTARPRSNTPAADGSSTDFPGEAVASSTMRSTWPLSLRFAILAPRDACTSNARSLKVKPRGRPCDRSSARSVTPCTANCSSTPDRGPGGHSGTTSSLRHRLSTLRGRFFGEVTPGPIKFYAAALIDVGSISRAPIRSKLGS
jgi:hypothetical protein